MVTVVLQSCLGQELGIMPGTVISPRWREAAAILRQLALHEPDASQARRLLDYASAVTALATWPAQDEVEARVEIAKSSPCQAAAEVGND